MANQTEADRRHIYATAKALGAELGMVDPTDVRSIVDELRVDEFGEVPGLKQRIEALKSERPHWFAGDAAPAGTRRRPVATPIRSADAGASGTNWGRVSDAEFRAEMSRFGVR